MHSRRPWPVSKTRVWVLTWYGTGRGLGEAEAAGREEVEAGREVDCIVEEVVETRPLTKKWEEEKVERNSGQRQKLGSNFALATRTRTLLAPAILTTRPPAATRHRVASRVI